MNKEKIKNIDYIVPPWSDKNTEPNEWQAFLKGGCFIDADTLAGLMEEFEQI